MSPEPVGLLSATAHIGGYRSVVQFRENITRYVDPLSTEKNSIYWDRSETPAFTIVNCRSIAAPVGFGKLKQKRTYVRSLVKIGRTGKRWEIGPQWSWSARHYTLCIKGK